MGKAKHYGKNVMRFVHNLDGTHTNGWGLKQRTFFCDAEASSPLFAYPRDNTDNLLRYQVTEGLQRMQLWDNSKLSGFISSNFNRDG